MRLKIIKNICVNISHRSSHFTVLNHSPRKKEIEKLSFLKKILFQNEIEVKPKRKKAKKNVFSAFSHPSYQRG